MAPTGATSTGDTTTLDANGLTNETARLSSEGEGPSGLLIASIVMLVAGTGLFAARWGARRLRAT